MTLPKNKTYVLIDMPNTLFDARHRTDNNICYISDIMNDKLNYTCFLMMKHFKQQGYHIVLTHYALSRLRYKVEQLLRSYYIADYYDELYINFNTQNVYDNQTLKKHLYEKLLIDKKIAYIIDNDPEMQMYWQEKEEPLIQIPLSL